MGSKESMPVSNVVSISSELIKLLKLHIENVEPEKNIDLTVQDGKVYEVTYINRDGKLATKIGKATKFISDRGVVSSICLDCSQLYLTDVVLVMISEIRDIKEII